MDGGCLCILTGLMWEWQEMQFFHISAETESKNAWNYTWEREITHKCTFWQKKSRVLHKPAQCCRSRACSWGTPRAQGGGRVVWDVGLRSVWPPTWLPGYRTSWVQCYPLVILQNPVACLSAGSQGAVVISSPPPGNLEIPSEPGHCMVLILLCSSELAKDQLPFLS